MARRRGPFWRAALSWLFLILFCVAAPLAVATACARLSVRDPEIYAAAVRRVVAEPRVQAGLTAAVTARAERSLGGENPTATEAVQARVLSQAMGDATSDVIASDEFLETWEEANRSVYRLLLAGSGGGWGTPVILDLSPLLDQFQGEIDALAAGLPAEPTLDAEDLRIPLLDAATADRLRRAAAQIDVAFWIALAGMLLSFILSVALAVDRLAAVARIAFGLAIAMIALIAAMLVTQQWVASAAGDGAGIVLAAITEAISQGLRLATVGLALAGLLLAGLFAGLNALRP